MHVGWRITRRTLQLGVNASHDSLAHKAQMIAVVAGGPDQRLRTRLMLPRKTRSRVRKRRRPLLSAGVSPAASRSRCVSGREPASNSNHLAEETSRSLSSGSAH